MELDFERVVDDWIVLSFFVGNDFIPSLPSLKIREGAISVLAQKYRKQVRICTLRHNFCLPPFLFSILFAFFLPSPLFSQVGSNGYIVNEDRSVNIDRVFSKLSCFCFPRSFPNQCSSCPTSTNFFFQQHIGF